MPSTYYAVRCLLHVQQLWLQRSGTGCYNFQHAAPQRRVAARWTPKKYYSRPIIGGLASLGWMGKQGVAIESGCCKSTGKVPVMEQSEYESANDALVRTGHSEPRIWNKRNIVCDIVCNIAYNMMQRAYDVWLKTYDIAYDESIRHRMSWHTMSYVWPTS